MITHTFPKNFFPLIETTGARCLPHCLNRPLVEGDPHLGLFVAYSVIEQHTNKTLTNSAFQSCNITSEEVESIAVQNWLEAFSHVNWETLDHSEDFRMLACRDDSDGFSGGVVSMGIRKGMHKSLGAEIICIGIPDRYTIVASTLEQSFFLKGVVNGMYDDAVRDNTGPLTPMLLISENGNLVGYVKNDPAKEEATEPDTPSFDPVELMSEAPLNVFLLIAAADGTIDEKEERAFIKALSSHQGNTNELFQTSLASCSQDVKEHFVRVHSYPLEHRLARLRSLRELLLADAPDDCEEYLQNLYSFAEKIAKASGGSLFRSKIGKEEKAVLTSLKKILGI